MTRAWPLPGQSLPVSRPRPAEDTSRRRKVLATEGNFTIEGYLEANPDLRTAAEDPTWDARAHFHTRGRTERRRTYVDVGA